MKRRILALLLVLCTLTMLGTVGANAAGVTWSFDADTGILTISGTGAMDDYYAASYTPWKAHQSAIRQIVIGEGVTTIGNHAFSHCSNLVSVQIPQSVGSIGKNAFFMCRSLQQVQIPAAVETIGSYAFFGCAKLTGIQVAQDNPSYCSDSSGVLYNKAKTVLIQAPGSLSGSYAVAAATRQILDQAFNGCAALTGVALPEDLTTIGSAAFHSCRKLAQVKIPAKVSSIGDNAFVNCLALAEFVVDEANEHYSSDASGVLLDKAQTVLIQAPGALADTYTLPASVTAIREDAFWSCEALFQVQLPQGLKTIGNTAFANCSLLESLEIPGTVTEIGSEAFSGCISLLEITFTGSAPTIGRNAFSAVAADALYPENNATWTLEKRQNYGGELTWTAAFMPVVFTDVSMNLGNSLTMYFKLNGADVPEGCKAVITKNYADGREPVVTEIAQKDWLVEGELYSIPVNNIAAKEMSDIVSVVILDGSGNAISEVKNSSVRAYAMMTLNTSNDAKLLTLMAELLNYGAAAQTQFGYGTSDLANAKMNATHQSYATADTSILVPKANRGDAIKVQSFNMTLESSLLLNLKYYPADVTKDMTAKVSYTTHAGTVTSYEIPGSAFEMGTDGYLWVSLSSLAAADINTVATVEIISNGAVISTTQINMAVAVAIDGGATPAMTAMSRYCVAAYNFFH